MWLLRAGLALAILTAGGCAIPFWSEPTVEQKVECDNLAGQAIETPSLEIARAYAAEAARCYSEALARGAN